MQLKRADQVLEILKVLLVKKVIFKKTLKFIKEKVLNVKESNVMVLLQKKIFPIDPPFFVIHVKNNQLFD